MRIKPLSLRMLSLFVLAFGLVAMPFTGLSVSAEVVCESGAPAGTTVSATPSASPAVPMDVDFPEEGGTLTIFAAASLTDAFDEMKQRLEEEHPGLDIVIETAGSQTLVTQLQQGAEADVLATANLKWMTAAIESDLVDGEGIEFTANRLVIVTPAGNPADLSTIDDLAGDDVTLILANPDVPAGNYAQQAFCTYASADDAPEDFIDQINTNLVSEEQDVRSVLAKIQLGEADAGVVYASDAAAAAKSGNELNIIEFPESVPTHAEYPIAPLAGGNSDLANAFIAYVMSDEGQEILADYGFAAAE